MIKRNSCTCQDKDAICRPMAFMLVCMEMNSPHTENIESRLMSHLARTALVIIALACIWFFSPDQREERLPDLASTPRENPEPDPEEIDTARMNVMMESMQSETATSEMMEGRLILDTRIPEPKDKKGIYEKLLLRRGVVISMDSNGTYHHHSLSSGRLALADVPDVDLPLGNYALHRPRRIDPGDHHFLCSTILPGEEMFLVMPNKFEAGIFASIESVLPKPLSEYGKASLSINLSSSGHLNFNLLSVQTNEGARQNLNHSFRGI